jgi:hypothetical protein
MASPYAPPQTPPPPRSVTIHDRTRIVLPQICVLCGAKSDELVEYTQDSAPITLPGIGIVRTTRVTAPYCTGHAVAFRRRFTCLRWAQGVAYVATLAVIPGLPRFNRAFTLPVILKLLCMAVGIAAFLFLVATIFVVKPFLYDIFYTVSGNRVRVRASVPFLESLIALNPGNVEKAS